MNNNEPISEKDKSPESFREEIQNLEPNDESLEAIRETDELIAKGGPGCKSAAEMFASMGL